MNQNQVVYTAFECDRCGLPNATRIRIAIKQNKDKEKRPLFKEFDFCSRCVIALAGALMNKLEWDEREAWMKSFTDGIIS